MIKCVFFLLLFLIVSQTSGYTYYETHPPYQFKQGPYKHLDIQSLEDEQCPQIIKKNSDLSPPHDIFEFDIDGNGLKDYIVLLYYGASSFLGGVEIYLRRQEGGYQKIYYEDAAGISLIDFVDIDNDGKWEAIYTDIYKGENHNYFSYNVYQFKDYQLVNADKKFKGFPKFVWMTNNPNDKDTVHLSPKDRQEHVEEKNHSIRYELITGQKK